MMTRTKQELAGTFLFVAGLVIGHAVTAWKIPTQVLQPLPTVKTVIVEKPVISERVVKQVIENPKTREQVNQLLAQNAQLQAQVTALTVTEAHSESHGSGVVETVPGAPTESPAVVQTPTYHFKDWRLDFTTDTKTASYTLSQRFEILHTTGRLPDGKPLSLISVSEIGENQERIVIPASITAIFADQTRWHWQTGIRVQAGIATAIGLSTKVTTSGAVGIQWLSQGRTHSAEDSRLALLTPVVTFGGTPEVGILPASYNLGQIPHQPFKDIWASPYVGADVLQQRVSRIGVMLSSSF